MVVIWNDIFLAPSNEWVDLQKAILNELDRLCSASLYDLGGICKDWNCLLSGLGIFPRTPMINPPKLSIIFRHGPGGELQFLIERERSLDLLHTLDPVKLSGVRLEIPSFFLIKKTGPDPIEPSEQTQSMMERPVGI